MNKPLTTIYPTYGGEPYKTEIAQVIMKGCEIKPVGKTGYFSEKVPKAGPAGYRYTGSNAPAYYRLRGPDGKVIDHFLNMANLRAGVKRRYTENKP